MEPDYLMLAQAVAIYDGMLFIHGGAVTGLNVVQIPWLATVSVAGRLTAPLDELGSEHTFSVVVLQPDGEPVFPVQPLTVTLGDEHLTVDQASLAVLVALDLNPLALTQTGWYYVDIGIDNESVKSLPFVVRVIS